MSRQHRIIHTDGTLIVPVYCCLVDLSTTSGITPQCRWWGRPVLPCSRTAGDAEGVLGCHRELHPGLVASWEKSRHSRITPASGLLKESISRRVSSESIDKSLRDVVVGCYECHSLRTEQHADSFEHNGYRINVIVSPKDCATCHSVEAGQYSKNIMSHAYGNLVDNSLYRDMISAVNNNYHRKDKDLMLERPASALNTNRACTVTAPRSR